MQGGYDEGYKECHCFWGREPGSLLGVLEREVGSFSGKWILDLGCGEGKNSGFLAERGARVFATDVSLYAIANALSAWKGISGVSWSVLDAREISLPAQRFDVIIAYGLLHCLRSADEIAAVVKAMKWSTKKGGFNVVCAMNDRRQELIAHPGFDPCLLPHQAYIDLFADWRLIEVSDRDLREIHPHNQIEHTHSMTRLVVQR